MVRRVAAPPSAFPWAAPMVVLLLLGAVFLYYTKRDDVYDAATIARVSLHDPSTWYRMVAGLFVHGAHHEFQALIVVGVLVYNGIAVERAVGAGSFLFAFLAGGIAGDIVRVNVESAALLSESAGTTAGALAIVGLNVSVAIRARQRGFVAAIVSGIASLFFTTLFTAAPQQGVNFMRVLPPMLPAAATAFLVGGFLGTFVPLYAADRGRRVRGALLVVSLGVLGAGAYGYWSNLWPLIKPMPQPRPRRLNEPALEMKTDPRLKGYEFGVPLSHRIVSDTDASLGVVLAPNMARFPIVRLKSVPHQDSADGIAFKIAYSTKQEYPDSKPVDEGPIQGCPLGPGYRHVLRVNNGQDAIDFHINVVEAGEECVLVIVQADPDEIDQATALGQAIARSLKLHSAPTDKNGGGR